MGHTFTGDRRLDVVMSHVCIRCSHRVLDRERDDARVDARSESRGTEARVSRRR